MRSEIWLGVLVFCAASRRLRARDQWIGWSEEQRRRHLPLVVNNCRFILLPNKTFPHLASRSLRLRRDRLSDDWQARYHHPVLLVETFVDPEQFCGTVYSANSWTELGRTDGSDASTAISMSRTTNPKASSPANTRPAPDDELIVLDGQQPAQGGGTSVLTAVSVPSQYYLGSATVDTKTNEIPVARELFDKLGLDGCRVSLDALHTQDQTARDVLWEHGADYLFTVKDNQTTVRANIERLVEAPPARFSPCGHDADAGRQTGTQQSPMGRTHSAQRSGQS